MSSPDRSTPLSTSPTTSDTRRIFLAQALRAFAYGFASVLLSTSLADRGLSRGDVGLVLGAILAGTATTSLLIGRYGDRLGRRRWYALLFALLGATGVVFAFASSAWVLAVAGGTGSLSTEVVESGPFTTLEQSMLATGRGQHARTTRLSRYNAVATASGSLGALTVALLDLLHRHVSSYRVSPHWFLLFVPIAFAGAFIARSLSPAIEAPATSGPTAHLERSRGVVWRLSSLFALDSFAGGITVSVFIGFYLHTRFHASSGTIGVLFFLFGVLQTASFLAAPLLARRFGLLRTMVFTHLPTDLLLMGVALAPSLSVAIALLLLRTCLSQMDVPTRQAYVMTLVDSNERTPAAAHTNTARYLARPLGPPLASALSQVGLGVPFLVAGSLKAVYDVALWSWFRRVALPDEGAEFAPRPLT